MTAGYLNLFTVSWLFNLLRPWFHLKKKMEISMPSHEFNKLILEKLDHSVGPKKYLDKEQLVSPGIQ